jgi:prepilin-type processing-associated H-X9-DG protein
MVLCDTTPQYRTLLHHVFVTAEQMSPDRFVRPDSGDTPPPGKTFDEKIGHLMDGGHEPYVYVGKDLTGKSPADAVLFYEPISDDGYGGHIAFADGHVELFSPAVLREIIHMDHGGVRPIYWPPHPATQP